MIIETYKYPVSLYAICLILSILAGFSVASLILVKNKTNPTAIACSLVLNGPLLFFFGLLFTYIVNIGKGIPSPGFTSIGGAIGITVGSIVMYIIFRDPMLMKAYTCILPLAYSISKIGCFLGGCCGGKEYHGPLAVNYLWHDKYAYPTLTFPIQLLESIIFMIIFIVIIILFKKLNWSVHIAVNGIICSIAKFCLDFFRDSHTGTIISINQILCLISLSVSVVLLIFRNKFKLKSS